MATLHAGVNEALQAVAEERGFSIIATCRITHVYTDGCGVCHRRLHVHCVRPHYATFHQDDRAPPPHYRCYDCTEFEFTYSDGVEGIHEQDHDTEWEWRC